MKERDKKMTLPFSECLKQAREKAGLSQKELAQIINVPPPVISRYETSDTEPRIGTVLNIAKALNISIDELLQIKTTLYSDIQSNNDCVMAANHYANLLLPNFKLEYQDNIFHLIALKNFDSNFFKPIYANDIITLTPNDFLVLISQIKTIFDKKSKETYNEIVLNCFISYAQMYNWRKEHESK